MAIKLRFMVLALLLFLFSGSVLCAETIYTWTDPDGTLHMSNRKPPKNVKIQDQIDYEVPVTGPPSVQAEATTAVTGDALTLARELAVREGKTAETARRQAQEAIERAQRLEQEATDYYDKVKNKALKRKSLRIKVEKQFKAVDQAKAEAERLKRLADEAEQRARTAQETIQKLNAPAAPQP